MLDFLVARRDTDFSTVQGQAMNMQSKLKAKLTNKYRELFGRYGIDEKTGRLEYCPCRKFAGTSAYGEAAKILIVGLDIGKDETPERMQPGWFQSFEERRVAIATNR